MGGGGHKGGKHQNTRKCASVNVSPRISCPKQDRDHINKHVNVEEENFQRPTPRQRMQAAGGGWGELASLRDEPPCWLSVQSGQPSNHIGTNNKRVHKLHFYSLCEHTHLANKKSKVCQLESCREYGGVIREGC